MKVKSMKSARGNDVPNQFIIDDVAIEIPNTFCLSMGTMFQSYNSNVAFRANGTVYLDSQDWDYSRTTGKYRNQFLNETKADTQRKIDSGEYKLVDLN